MDVQVLVTMDATGRGVQARILVFPGSVEQGAVVAWSGTYRSVWEAGHRLTVDAARDGVRLPRDPHLRAAVTVQGEDTTPYPLTPRPLFPRLSRWFQAPATVHPVTSAR